MRKVVVEVQCSRCERKESLEYDPSKDAGAAVPVFEAQLRPGEVVRFDDLCSPCQRSVKALLEQIGKKVKGMSPDRVAKEEKPPEKVETKAPPAETNEVLTGTTPARSETRAKKEDPAPSPTPGLRSHPPSPTKGTSSRAS